MNMNLKRQLANGNWAECGDRTDEFLTRCSENQNISINELKTKLSNCEKMSYGSDWNENIVDADAFEKRESEKKPNPELEMTKCSCGHTIPKHLVMSASMGTSCEHCYDRMSD